ncbi:hypothetical protein JHN62_36965, partial [Streptomyces sp. MBT54]|uniref:hypothetical protein n=1 Tax=Streptomyces sp. MBT54 TaxID=1488385 RepID=UPI00190C5196
MESDFGRRAMLLAGSGLAAGVALSARAVAAPSGKETAAVVDEQVYVGIREASLFGYTLVANEIGLLAR